MKNIKKFVRHNAGTIWEDQPRDENGRWVKTGTRLSKIIKNKADRDKIRTVLNNSHKSKLEKSLANAVEKKEKYKENKSFYDIYKPSETVSKKLKNPKNDINDVDDAIAQEAHKPYVALAKARMVKEGLSDADYGSKKAFNDAVEDTAGEYALKARERETTKIDAITKGNRYIETKKGEVEIDEGTWISKYTKYKYDDSNFEESGFFRTAEELKKILED